MLTVLHIFSGDLWAGAEVMIFNLLTSLKEHADLRLVALSLNDGTLTRNLEASGIEVHVIPEGKESFPGICRKASALVRNRGIDVIHSHRYKENMLALLVAKTIGLKGLVSTLHGMPEPVAEGKKTPAARLKTKACFYLLRHFFNKTVAVSSDIQTRLVSEFGFVPARTEVIHNGIDPSPLITEGREFRLTGRPLHIGSVGRLVPVKGYDFFLRVAAKIARELPDVRFSILGDGPLKEQLQNQAREYGLEGKLALLAPVPNPASFYHSLDVYLNTSLHEGIPLSILEAMFCRVPVVAPRVGGLPEIIVDRLSGILVSPREPEILARSCLELLRDAGIRQSLSQKGYEQVNEHFRARKMAERYHNLYLQAA